MKQIFTVTGAHRTSSQAACNKAQEKANTIVLYIKKEYTQTTILDLVTKPFPCPQGFVQSIDILIDTENVIHHCLLPYFEEEDDFPEEIDYHDHCDDNDAIDNNYPDYIHGNPFE